VYFIATLQNARRSSACDPAELGARERADRVREIHMIERVEGLEPDFQPSGFAHMKGPAQRYVDVEQHRPPSE
jgi:hypothetical protein